MQRCHHREDSPARSGAEWRGTGRPAPVPAGGYDPDGIETAFNAHSWMMRLLYMIRVTL